MKNLDKEKSLNLHNKFIFSRLIKEFPYLKKYINPEDYYNSVRAYRVNKKVFQISVSGFMIFEYLNIFGIRTSKLISIDKTNICYTYLQSIQNINNLKWIIIVGFPELIDTNEEYNQSLRNKLELMFYKVDNEYINQIISSSNLKAENSVYDFLNNEEWIHGYS